MIHAGLTSITFRKHSPADVVDLVVQAGLEGIEWGGDIHVPHGDIQRATEVFRMTVDAGLKVASYGSYYRVGHEEPVPFDSVLNTAIALNAPAVRVWAGRQGSENADPVYRRRVVEETRRIADMTQATGRTIAFEFHGNTLTDTSASAVQLLKDVSHDAVTTYWQAQVGVSEAYRLEGLEVLLPWLSSLHVFHLGPERERQPLAEGSGEWSHYLARVTGTGREHWALIEFVREDAPAAFLEDARTLKGWLEAL